MNFARRVRRWLTALIAASLALLAAGVRADHRDPAAGAALEIAIAPFLPVQVLFAHYEPLRTHLEQTLQRPVTFVAAPDYRVHNERLLHEELDFTITVANSATLAIAEHHYVPLLCPAIYTRPTVVAAAAGPIHSVAELKGHAVGTTDPLGMIAMQAARLLLDNALPPGDSVKIQHFPNHAAAVNYVLSGEIAAAIISDRALTQLPHATREKLRVVTTWEQGAAPGLIYLASSRVPESDALRIKHAVQTFANDTPQGQQLMNKLGYGALLDCNRSDLENLLPYAQELKRRLAARH